MRALIKHELRNIWMMILYFVGCFVVGAWFVQRRLQGHYKVFLRHGYDYDMSYTVLGAIQQVSTMYLLMIGLGLLVLLYIQFRDNKSIGVSSFIKSLPYTNKQIYSVKLVCGILSFSIPLVLGYGAIIGIGEGAKDWLSIIERVSPMGTELAKHNELGQVVLYGLLVYSMTLMVYVLGFWMQYVINPNIGSLVVSACSLVAPWFILLAGGEYLRGILGGSMLAVKMRYLDTLQELLLIPVYFDTYHQGYQVNVGQMSYYIRNSAIIELAGVKIFMFLLLAVIFILGIGVCNKTYHAENQEVFISRRWAEKLLKVGVVVSCMALGVIVSLSFFNLRGIELVIVVHLAMITCGIIGYLIIRKICKIGQR